MNDRTPNIWPDLEQRRKRLRLASLDYSDPYAVYFVTLCARQHNKPFSNPSLAQQINLSLLFRSHRGDWRLYAYCLMPDHLHLALSPQANQAGIPRLMQGFKSFTTRLAWQYEHKGALWQRSYYDHIARQEEDVLAMCEYILLNPVRKGLVDEPSQWPYSGIPNPLPM